jgi:aryl-alcohol dehydrogenase-like predicted oxidoreductase
MRFKLLGKSGLRVSELCLGTMTFGEDWGWGASKDECRRIFEAFVAAGGNFVDTANNYTEGSSEKIVGELIGPQRDQFVLATKYTLCQRRGDPNACGNHRKNMVQSLHASLKRLNTDYVDLYWVHAWDYLTPVEEVVRALDDMVSAGKVLHIGMSDTPAWVIAQGNTLADLRGWSRFVAVQAPYNLLERELEGDMLPMARAFNMAAVTWGSLSSGKLTGKHTGHTESETKRRWWDIIPEREHAIIAEVVKIAGELERTPSQVAINWVRQQQDCALLIPVLGARTAAQITDNLGCLDFTLAPDHLARLNAVSEPELGFPHDFLASDSARRLVYGSTLDRIDFPRSGGR